MSGLDADIEIVACGPDYTDVQLLGRYEFADGVERWTADASLAHRIAVSVVRRFLGLLAERLADDRLALTMAAVVGLTRSRRPPRPNSLGSPWTTASHSSASTRVPCWTPRPTGW